MFRGDIDYQSEQVSAFFGRMNIIFLAIESPGFQYNRFLHLGTIYYVLLVGFSLLFVKLQRLRLYIYINFLFSLDSDPMDIYASI